MNEIDKILARESVELMDAVQRNEPDAAERLAKWLKQSKRHAEHYLMAAAFERELDRIQFDPHLEIATPSQSANVVPLKVTEPALPNATSRPQRIKTWMTGALAAGIAAMALVYWQAHRDEYTTVVGEQRVIELADGSIVHLNTQSRIGVRFSDKGRDIELSSGEALFKVQRDPARPFRVHTGDAVIQAIGTEFNVYRRSEGTTVAVLEGRVKVTGSSETDLVRGQAAQIDHHGGIATQKTEEVAKATAWRQRRLIFAGTPLPEIVAEFNRYNRSPQLALEGTAADRVFSGVFDADDPESLIQLLQREPDIQFVREEERIVVRVKE